MSQTTSVPQKIGLEFKVTMLIAGVFLCAGRVPLAAGYYFLILIPALLLVNDDLLYRTRAVGFYLLSIYFLFPAVALVHLLGPDLPALLSIPKWPEIFYRASISSVVGVSGVLTVLFSSLRLRFGKPSKGRVLDWRAIWRWYEYGILLGMIIILIYCFIQAFTGFNFIDRASYREDRLMGDILYRVTGASDHPLTFAGFALTLNGLAMGILCGRRQREFFNYRLWIFIYFSTAILIALSGSRFAIVLCLGGAAGFALYSSRTWSRAALTVLGAMIVGGLFAWSTGLLIRFAEINFDSLEGLLGQRWQIWKAHQTLVREHWGLGVGDFWLDHWYRELIYINNGLPQLNSHYNSHNVFIELILSLGALGGALFLGLLYLLAMKVKAISINSSITRGIVVAVIFNVCHGLVQTSLFETPVVIAIMSFGIFGVMMQNQPRGISMS
jgi:O-antigen ligase